MAKATCTVATCDEHVESRGLCGAHYARWRLTGVVGGDVRRRRRKGRVCDLPDCDSPHAAKGYCNRHYLRLWSRGNVGDPVYLTGPDNPAWREVVKYRAAHVRVAVQRGPASDHECVDCGGAARQWSYDAADPNEMIDSEHGATPFTYSLDPEHYSPRCVSCHMSFDAALR